MLLHGKSQGGCCGFMSCDHQVNHLSGDRDPVGDDVFGRIHELTKWVFPKIGVGPQMDGL